jgi:hypothetical protein
MTSEVIDRPTGPDLHRGSFNKQEVAMNSLRQISFLRAALLIDAVASGLTAALLVAGADLLRDWLGLPVALMREAGVVLVFYVAFVVFVATRAQIAAGAVWAVIACNVLWTIASFAVLKAGLVAPTTLGIVFVIGQALAVLALGALQLFALRRPQALLV